MDATDTTECLGRSAQGLRILQLLKENRIEMMILTILLYSTGLLEQVIGRASGVCF